MAVLAGAVFSDGHVEPERVSVAVLPPTDARSHHWLWVPDRLLQHNLLYDGDTGEVLGMVDSPSLLTPKTPLLSRDRGEIYSADTAYSRGMRGKRIDFVSIYDAHTLRYVDEVVVPTRIGSSNASLAYAELIGERFLGVFNQFPNVSVAIVDLDERRFAGEVVITGCSGIYPVDEVEGVSGARFATLCGNGTVHLVTLDDRGGVAARASSTPFFDVVDDPVAMSAGRDGSRWFFVSFRGQVHAVDFGGDTPVAEEAWSLVGDGERGWRPGGLQQVAFHSGLGRLFVVMHEGGPGSHKEAGPEIWVYDVARRERIARFELPNLTAAFLGPQIDAAPGSFTYSLLEWLLPSSGAHAIAVSGDAAPLLFARNAELGAVAVLDARTGESLRVLTEAGLAGPTLRVP